MACCDYVFDSAEFKKYQVDYYNDIDDVILDKNHRDFVKLIREAVKNELNEIDKKIVSLYYYRGFKQSEVAFILKIPPCTVSRHISRINAILYEKLKYAVQYRFGFTVNQDTSLIEIALAVAKEGVKIA